MIAVDGSTLIVNPNMSYKLYFTNIHVVANTWNSVLSYVVSANTLNCLKSGREQWRRIICLTDIHCVSKKSSPLGLSWYQCEMKTNLNNISQKCTWQNLQQNYMQQMWDLFVERRYFKVQNEIQFSSNSIMEQLKHRDSDSFCDRNMSCFYHVLHHRPITCMTGLC